MAIGVTHGRGWGQHFRAINKAILLGVLMFGVRSEGKRDVCGDGGNLDVARNSSVSRLQLFLPLSLA